jgi:hypothetical protein
MGGLRCITPLAVSSIHNGSANIVFVFVAEVAWAGTKTTQPRWGWFNFFAFSQGSSFLATLGWQPQSLWDWHSRNTVAATPLGLVIPNPNGIPA